ncbi:MAG: hypothetical protein R2719_10505 [Micropruina sp.]
MGSEVARSCWTTPTSSRPGWDAGSNSWIAVRNLAKERPGIDRELLTDDAEVGLPQGHRPG